MKKIFATALGLMFAATLSIQAADFPEPPAAKPAAKVKAAKPGKAAKKAKATVLTDEQKKQKQDLLDKYDANKDGKLNKKERAKVSAEDDARLEQFGLAKKDKPAK